MHRSSLSSVNLNPSPLAVQPVRNWDSVDIHTIVGPQCKRPSALINPLLLDLPSGDLELSPQIVTLTSGCGRMPTAFADQRPKLFTGPVRSTAFLDTQYYQQNHSDNRLASQL
jgi:hypothetical protein